MKQTLSALVALLALVFAAGASADTTPPPFPSTAVGDVFVSVQTITSTKAISDYFAPGHVVFFRAYAVDTKTHQLLTKKTLKYTKGAVKRFYIALPNGQQLGLRYRPLQGTLADGRYRWIGMWRIPSDFPLGTVKFEVKVKTWANRTGSFTQVPVASAQLTIAADPQLPMAPGPTTPGAVASKTLDVALYADTVNGTHPAGTAARPVGCTQTNVFKRGEQLVVRAFGFDLGDGSILSMTNVTDAHFSVAGVPNTVLNWGAHGPTGAKVYFWSNQWQIPASYPLGDTVIHLSFTTLGGKTGTLDYPITIIP